jgi:NADH-quinone oxidoreductase chain G
VLKFEKKRMIYSEKPSVKLNGRVCVSSLTTIVTSRSVSCRVFSSSSVTRLAVENASKVKMLKLRVDGCEVEVPEGASMLQACEKAGRVVPRFCYHERLSIAGNCRMCLVEVGGSPKLQASCAMPVMAGSEISTDSPAVRKAREGVMELLLVNHPLDCPICDQGGECDLQDQAMTYGSDHGRFQEYKRSVQDKNLGPLVKTVMTRCIHCTRCLRFASEMGGLGVLGTMGRGNNMEIALAPSTSSGLSSSSDMLAVLSPALDSELSGNLIDLCPVGALTSLPYAFTSRPWEIKSIESVDVLDGVGSKIRIDVGQGRSGPASIMRVLPRGSSGQESSWISDKTRFSYDGLKAQRLTTPMVRDAGGDLVSATWSEAFRVIAEGVSKSSSFEARFGSLLDAETQVAARDFLEAVAQTSKGSKGSKGSKKVSVFQDRVESTSIHASNADLPSSASSASSASFVPFVPSDEVEGLGDVLEDADVVLFVGMDPRMEASVVNAALRGKSIELSVPFTVAYVGAPVDLSYPAAFLGSSAKTLAALVEGSHPYCKRLVKAKSARIVVGQSVSTNKAGSALWGLAEKLASRFGSSSVYHLHPSIASSTSVGLGSTSSSVSTSAFSASESSGDVDSKFILEVGRSLNGKGAPSSPSSPSSTSTVGKGPQSMVVVVNHHGDDWMGEYADVVLPSAAYTEVGSNYLSTTGQYLRSRIATRPPGQARETWRIFRALLDVVGKSEDKDLQSSPFFACHSGSAMSDRLATFGFAKSLRSFASSTMGASYGVRFGAGLSKGQRGVVDCNPFHTFVEDYHRTDAVSASSSTMLKCSAGRRMGGSFSVLPSVVTK